MSECEGGGGAMVRAIFGGRPLRLPELPWAAAGGTEWFGGAAFRGRPRLRLGVEPGEVLAAAPVFLEGLESLLFAGALI